MAGRRNPTTLTLPSDRELVITRVFDAPRELVFEAWTRAEHVRHWYGLRRMTLVVCEIDLRVGGRWRFVVRDPEDGNDYGFTGVYREIVPPERLVYTEGFEGLPGHEALTTLTFAEQEGKTALTIRLLYRSAEDRDTQLRLGMEPGMRETLDRLAEHLATLA
ncbi:MAG TPA: SRPBCC family protein [Chloroflexota bacterium]|jgi:uncharacterized protein YndB with AHSA1/START domain|nr:SRPBCC family protein [Chloroflexota bacterium]